MVNWFFRLAKTLRGVILLRTSTSDPVRRLKLLERVLKSIEVEGEL